MILEKSQGIWYNSINGDKIINRKIYFKLQKLMIRKLVLLKLSSGLCGGSARSVPHQSLISKVEGIFLAPHKKSRVVAEHERHT
jgi:hypothetical protein